ncbi:MAG: sensor histidine kinase [Oscillospiraceae bacterium]|nr:sensor histidine kinase [Oscillospiraceae bacterium]
MSDDIFERNEELCGVLRQVSGQLRASLGNIYTALQSLAPPDLRDEDGGIDRNAAVLCQSYYRIMRLADNLADAAHLNEPGTPNLRNDDIAALCQALAQEAQYPAKLLGLELVYRPGTGCHIILMDRRRIKRLIMNLLSNAFKFTPSGGRVILELRVEPKWVTVTVSDNGCGIPAGLRDTVFDRYRHTDRLDPPPHGLGLGLPICRQIAQEHGGTLILPDVEEGTTVTVSLPNRRDRVKNLKTLDYEYDTFSRTLTELSDALPWEAFTRQYMD